MSTAAADAALPRPARRRDGALRRFMRHRLAVFGTVIIGLLALACAVGPYLLPFSDTEIDIMQRFAPPFSGAHLLGTDPLGRDILARILMAGRISLSVGFAAMVISMVIGTKASAPCPAACARVTQPRHRASASMPPK